MLKKLFVFLLDTFKIIIFSLLIVLPIRYFVMQPFTVCGSSMEPTFKNGDYLIINELSYFFRSPARGEVIVFKYPKDPRQYYIKRVIGLPEETVSLSEGKIIIFNQDQPAGFILEESYLDPVLKTYGNLTKTLASNEFFVLGDNRYASADSRFWGPLPANDLVGKVFLRLFNLSSFGYKCSR